MNKERPSIAFVLLFWDENIFKVSPSMNNSVLYMKDSVPASMSQIFLNLILAMGSQVSAVLGLKRVRKPLKAIAMKQIKKRYRGMCYRGMFNYSNGRNIPEDANPIGENQYVTVFFDWADRLRNDEQLMSLVVDRIMARDGIITPKPVHHEIRFCLSLRVPRHWNPTDVSIASCAKDIAEWHRSEIIHAGMKIDRSYLFRGTHFPAWKF